jgi:hypothetical protein
VLSRPVRRGQSLEMFQAGGVPLNGEWGGEVGSPNGAESSQVFGRFPSSLVILGDSLKIELVQPRNP